MENRLLVELLGSSFTIRSNEDPAYLRRILWYFEKKIDETRQRAPIADPIKIAILTGFYIVDELLQERSREGRDGMLAEESEEMEKIIVKLINKIEDVIKK